MNTGFLFRPRVRQATTIVLLLIAVSAMLPARHPLLVWWAGQAKWIALGYLLFAMALLAINRTRLMFVCLGCSAAISLFHNETNTGSSVQKLPAAEQPVWDTNPLPADEPAPTHQ